MTLLIFYSPSVDDIVDLTSAKMLSQLLKEKNMDKLQYIPPLFPLFFLMSFTVHYQP